MRVVAFSTVLAAAAAVAGPVLAQDGRAYIGGDIGVVAMSDLNQTWTPAATVGTTGRVDLETGIGLQGSLFLGYDFGRLAFEFEAMEVQGSIDSADSSFTSVGGQLTAGSQSADGDADVRIYMVNAVVDLGDHQGFSFFAGGGLGRGRLSLSGVTTQGGELIDDEEAAWRYGWQAFAGVRRQLSGNISGHLRYRYVSLDDQPDVDDRGLVGFGGRYVETAGFSQHSLTAGVTVSFW